MSADIRPASRFLRLMATFIDALLVILFALALMLVSGVLETAEDYANHPMLRVIGLGIASYLLLNGWLLWARGQTIGKLIFGIAMVRRDTGERVPLWRLLLVRGPVFILLPVIGELTIFGKARRCIHDYAAGTQVIRRRG